MGARIVMSGISTKHAAAITGLGLGTGGIETATTLADAVAVAHSLSPLPI